MRYAKFAFFLLLLIVLPYAGRAQYIYGNSSSPPPAAPALLGFPPPEFAPPNSPADLPLFFFEQVPADSQVSSISATVKAQSSLFKFDSKIDTAQTALQGWNFNISASLDSVRFVATAPAGVFFVHSDSMPAPLVRFLGQVAPEAAEGDSIEFKLRDVALVSKGNTVAFPDSIFRPGIIFVGQGGPGPGPKSELFAFSDTMAAPGSNVPIHLSLINPVPVDSQLSRIRGVIRAMPPELQWDSTGAIVSTALASWSLAVNTEGDSLIFDASAPANTYLAHDSTEVLRLFSFGATIRPSASPNMPISVIASQFYLTMQNSEQSFGPMIVRPGEIFVKTDSGGPPPPPPPPPSPPADGVLLGFPPPMFAPAGSPADLQLFFFEQVPVDSQVSSISATVKTHSSLFKFDPKIDTTQTALQGWNFSATFSLDSVRFVATAPQGVFFVHSDSMPVPLVRFLGQIAPEAAEGDSIEFKLHNVAIVSKGNSIAFADSIFAPGIIFVGQGGPGPGPESELFAFSDTMAAPGSNIPIHLSLINPVPVDSQLSRIRGVIRARPPELQWDSTGTIVSTALAGWSLAVHPEGDSLTFDATAPANTYLAHDSAVALRLFSFGATIRPSAPANMPISVIASQFYLTLQNSEQSFGPMIVRPGHVFAQSDSGGPPLPPPLPPPTASTEGRVNLGLYGGYALDMAYDEVNDVMLAAVAAPQSLFMSTDSGVTWSAVFPTDSLEFVTDNVTRGFGGRGMQVEASQGYCYSRTSQEAGTLTGAQVSEDGQNWRTLLDAYLIRELVKDRYPGAHDGPRAVNVMSSNGPIALVASENFVFRTADAGQTWSISVVPDTTALNAMTSVNLLCLRRGEANENSFYTILGGDPFNPVGRLFRTENGVDFTRLYIISGSDTAKVIVDVVSHPTNSDTLWVSTADMIPGLNGLWRSYDAGNTWSQLSLPAGHGMGIKLKLYQETALPGTDNIRLVAVGENRYSDDLGDNWTDFSPTDDPFVDRVSSANAGLGHIPNTDIYFGQGDASPSRSSNGLGGTYYFVPTGIEGITIWKIAQIPNEPDKVYLATSAGLAYTSSFTDTNVVSTAKWASPYGNYPINPVGGGNLGFTAIAINPDNTSHIVAANGNALFVSTNGGFTNNDWTSIAYHDVPGLDEQKFKSSGGRVSAFTFLNSDSIFAAAYCENIVYGALLLSEDGGNSWKALPQAGDHVFKAIIVAKTGTPNSEVLFASGGGVSDDPGGHASKIDTGAVYKSLDRGATWSRTSYGPQAVFNPAPFPLPVNDIVAKPGSVDTLYLACGENLSNAIAYTYDGGSTLHTISMQAIGAREGAFEAVAINKHHPDSIYFAIRRDILVYDALLDSATTLFRGYPGELTHALLYDDLTMGSSAGFFEITAPSNTPTTAIDERASQQPLQMELTQNYPNPFNPSTRIIFTLSQQSKVKLEVFNLLGQRVALLLSENLAAGKHEILWKPTKLTSGVYFYRLQATEKTGRTMAITKKLMLVR